MYPLPIRHSIRYRTNPVAFRMSLILYSFLLSRKIRYTRCRQPHRPTTPRRQAYSQSHDSDAGGERPVATQDKNISIRLSGAACRKDEGRRNQRIGIPAPDGVLGLPIKHAQHPVVASKIREIPRHGKRLPAPAKRHNRSERDIVKLSTSGCGRVCTIRNKPVSCKSRSVSGGRRRSITSWLRSAPSRRTISGWHGGGGTPRIGRRRGLWERASRQHQDHGQMMTTMAGTEATQLQSLLSGSCTWRRPSCLHS